MSNSLDHLFETQFEPMVRLARVLLGSDNEIEDVVMDAFEAVAKKTGAIDDEAAYLRGAVVNSCRKRARTVSTRRRIWHERVVSEFDPQQREYDYIADVLTEVSDRERLCLVLTYYGGFSQREIAETLDCPVGTVKSLVSRGLARLRQVVTA